MIRDDIIRLAREAGFEYTAKANCWQPLYPEDLEHFAALVAAAERERIVRESAPEIARTNAYIKALEALVRPAHVETIRARGERK